MIAGPAWGPPPNDFAISPDEVHVFGAGLKPPPLPLPLLRGILSSDEAERGARFYREEDRERFVAARGLLRIILGGYLERKPSDLRFAYGAHGKPALAAPDRVSLRFNVAHSGELVLVAIAQGRELGVDCEWVRDTVDWAPIAARFFSPGEQRSLRELPPQRQRDAFFRYWTRKEAYIKARGSGLALPLDQFDVSFSPDEAGLLAARPGEPGDSPGWLIRDLGPIAGYAAAIAAEGVGWRLACWRWPDQGARPGA